MITPITIAQSFFATVLIIAGVLGIRLVGLLLMNRSLEDED
jgi:hypothetical protein